MEIPNAGGLEASLAAKPSLIKVVILRLVMLESSGAVFSIDTGFAMIVGDLNDFMFGKREAFPPMSPPPSL